MNRNKFIILIILVIGLGIRLYLAKGSYNFDIVATQQDVEIFKQGKNIYLHQTAYNYSPLFYYLTGFFGLVQDLLPFLEIKFIARAFYSFIDLITFFVIYKIAIQRKLSPIKTAGLFFLNPISIIISGHHGQFDNIAIFFLLLSLYFVEKKKIGVKIKNKLIFTFLTIGLIVKHIIVFQVFYFFILYTKSRLRAIIFFVLSLVVFALTFMPFYSTAGPQIIKSVLFYGGVQGLYGFTYFLGNIFGNTSTVFNINIYMVYKLLFLFGFLFFVLVIRPKDIARGILLSILFFLTFTSGIGAQYFMLPIAFGVFFPTRWFYLYTLSVTLFFLGSADELNIYTFKVFEWNTVWLFTIFWFTSEMLVVSNRLNSFFSKISRKFKI